MNLEVSSWCFNSSTFENVRFSDYPNLERVSISQGSFRATKTLSFDHLPKLKVIEIQSCVDHHKGSFENTKKVVIQCNYSNDGYES